MGSTMAQFRAWRRDQIPDEWKGPSGTIKPEHVEDALRTAYKLGALERKGIQGISGDVGRYLDFVDEPTHAPPAQFRRATMHRQQLTDAWAAFTAAADASDLPGVVCATACLVVNVGHAWAEFGVPAHLVWQLVTNAYKAKKIMGPGGACEYEADGRIKWPTGVLAMFADEVETAITDPGTE